MQPLKFEEVLDIIVERDRRYDRNAFVFLREALEYTQTTVGKPKKGEVRHVSGGELLDGIRNYAIEQFGPMVPTVFSEWGIHSCEDFGEMVFLLVAHNVLAKTENDSRDDFKNGYDFYEAFSRPFLPTSKQRPQSAKKSVKV
jgi:uncharacterized repeat protein (TIGR04138 family)